MTFNIVSCHSLLHFSITGVQEICKKTAKMSEAPATPPGRPMKFPYTFSAKIAQFPYKFYFTNQWIWKYYLIGVAVSVPIFYKISQLSNSPGNVAKWAESKRKDAEGHH